jgi:hypothetical protein
MGDRVAIGVADELVVNGDRHATQDQRSTWAEPMRVISDPDAHG